MPGTLYLVPTPIGNLGDISARMADTLAAVDFIAAEDTRVSLKLLNHLGIRKPMVSYYRHNTEAGGRAVLTRLLQGENCALVTDAGTPAVSDPGEELVALCAQNGVEVVAIPGPCALVTALAVSGHEAPHKLTATLSELRETFGGERRISLCRELSKLHEEVFRTTLDGAVERYAGQAPKGEFVLVLEGAAPRTEEAATLEDGLALVEKYREEGLSLKDASRQAAADTGLNRKALYDAAIGK